jgi:hypothetical protein
MKAFPSATGAVGMELRDYLAAKAMTGGAWVATTEGNTYERDAQECYKIADAMMKARDNDDI